MPSTVPTLLPFLLFAFVASITPGPTNILVLNNSARYGFKATLPLILAACASAAFIVLLAGCGIGEFLNRFPALQGILHWLGAIWLSYLAWQIFHSARERTVSSQSNQQRAGAWTAASLQWINPKTWMMAMTVVSVFAAKGADLLTSVLTLSVIFFLVALPCLCLWAMLAVGTQRWIRSPHEIQCFNRSMGLALGGSAWLSFLIG
ncbi:LysE family translocator [Pseudomonas sp. MDT2-39-1]